MWRLSDDEKRDLSEIRERMVRVETKLDDIKEDFKSAAEARDIARDAHKDAKNAHIRLNAIDDNQRWLWRTVFGAVLMGAIGLLFQIQGG